MNDRVFLLCLVYLVLTSFVMGLLPDGFYTGSIPTQLEGSDLQGDIDSTASVVSTSLTFFGKIMRFLFVPLIIQGIPTFLATILLIINMFTITFTILYIYKLIRGVS